MKLLAQVLALILGVICIVSFGQASRSRLPSTGELRVGSFNIQVFGVKKMSDPAVVAVLVDILSRYDICLVQEIRDASGNSIHTLVAKLNEKTGRHYKVVVSDRLGRTSSKEAYGFIYDPYKVYIVDANQYPSELNQFERPPFSVLIQSTTNSAQKWFLSGVHISPGVAPTEINKLYDVYQYYAKEPRYQGVISKNWLLMGDLNADCSYMKKSDWEENLFTIHSSQFKFLVHTGQDTTVSSTNCAYDRFLTNRMSFTPENTKVEIFKFDSAFNLNSTVARRVSDHYPIEISIPNW